MTPASEEFAEIARRLNEIKAERTKALVGAPEQAPPAVDTWSYAGTANTADYGDCC